MNENKADITVILDKSGSMVSVKADTIGGFNEFLKSQQKVPGEATISLYQFDKTLYKTYVGIPINAAQYLTEENYRPGGSTALLDAMGTVIDEVGKRLAEMPEEERPGRVLMVIQTDGFENASEKFKAEDISARIKHQSEVYNWEFIFLGATEQAIMDAGRLGIASKSTLAYASKDDGTSSGFVSTSNYVTQYRSASNLAGAKLAAFSAEDRKKQEEIKNKP